MKPLYILEQGAHFIYGDTEWVKLDDNNGVLCLAAEPVAFKTFHKDCCNNWHTSHLRTWLNGSFIESLISKGATSESFMYMDVDLTSNDGLRDYKTTIDKIALLSCEQYREYREYIPRLMSLWFTLTPRLCLPDYPEIFTINEDGVLCAHSALSPANVRPICCLKGNTSVEILGEETESTEPIKADADPIGKQIYEQLKNEYPDYTDDQIMDMLIVAMYYAAHE